jgi:four helix bundle protein
MSSIRSYKDLKVWNTALKLVGTAYKITEHFPREERFGLTSQLRRASVSVVANIAEGNGRLHRAEYVRHLSIARGSLLEAEALLYTAIYLKFLATTDAAPSFKLIDETGRMLTMLIRSLSAPKNSARATAHPRSVP